MQLQGQVAVITGAGSGFGRATGLLFAREGARVLAAPVNEAAARGEAREAFLPSIPMGRLIEPDGVAKAALYLASDLAQMITGHVLEVDGDRAI